MAKSTNLDEPSIRQIVAYWTQHQDECGLGVDWAEAHERCWRCGLKSRRLQKCHITPRARKGTLLPSNLVLLCRRCHRAAPNISDQKYMWIWLRTTCVPFYDAFIFAEAIFEFERMFGRKPFSQKAEGEVRKLLNKSKAIFESTVVHFGEGRRNAATWACIFAQVEETESGVSPEPRRSSWMTEYLFAPEKANKGPAADLRKQR